MSEPARSVAYSERLWPSPGMWVLVLLAALAGGLMVVPYGAAVWVICALLAALLTGAGLVLASAWVTVRDGTLRAGRAQIPVGYLGETSWADGEEARLERGPRLDARAYLLIRGWVRPVLRVEVLDPEDPTPYWLISTRHPEKLADAIRAARG